MRVGSRARSAIFVVMVLAVAASAWNLYALGVRVDEERRSPTDLELAVGWGALGLSLVLVVVSLIAVFARLPRSRDR